MAAGIIEKDVTYSTGNTLKQAFWVDDTVSPTIFIPLTRQSDGTSVAAVKAASTAPLAADQALVVVISPNGVAPTSVADGSDVTLGAKADAKSAATDTTPTSGIAQLKQINYNTALIAGGISGTATDRSGTITTGGTAQNIMASNSNRRGWSFFNNSDTDMMVFPAGTASASLGILVSPNMGASGDEQNAISVFCATTGKAFTAWEK